ncbi:MAG: ABC transporter ATP-binding protein [Kutzneria sp.]|nr:ABC transporter ATP-binding protein [Kutzneria sp.]MBV9847090.1 ABC transporter ATP-binding protein [Kutzneria sp.]
MSDGIAVTVDDLGKRYRRWPHGSVWALRHCSFELPAGVVAALVGMNGAGKTTLMSVVTGLLAPTEGAVRLGDDASRVSFVAQDKPLYRHFSVTDMLKVGASLNRVWDQRRALRWLERFQIPLDRPCGRLSGGQQAQVAFAIALGSCPSLLLLDEPLSNLDPLARREVTKELLGEVADTGLTVLLSTHVVAELGGVADHLLLLAAGTLLEQGDVDDLLASHVRYVGPRSDTSPGPGQILQARHTDRQSTFLVRLASDSAPRVDPPWTTQTVTLEDLVLVRLEMARSGVRGVAA